ncbi:cation transporter [Pseudoalteromonas sp. SWXJZ94C]|uniref:cation diffusion facilitator family transporter n=2 Tax=unclassified Pseudoalteromonas TaxID=194690 RepID=UPI0018CE3469|nr:cation diffusion facilitator family transporter [Pseudoalteromonas sp. SWXJZ94C]MBH0055478.1 cation transporter [Pseudoalteromonas sp. SWXJZ94C]
MGHDHSHSHVDENQSNKQLTVAVVINVLLTVAQVIGGVFSGSLSLIADALHNLSDAAAIFIALVARKIGNKPANDTHHFGYKRAEILATLFNSSTLIIIGVYLVFESISSYFNPQPINGWIVVWVAAIALVVDLVTAFLTYRAGANHSMNIRAAFIHNVSDAMASIVVIVAGTLIILYQWYIVDLIATILISVYVIYHGVLLLKESCKILMQAAPSHFDNAAVTKALIKKFQIQHVASIKAWQLDDKTTHCELVINTQNQIDLEAIKHYLHDHFNIENCIIENQKI